jgi:hypothetical protein
MYVIYSVSTARFNEVGQKVDTGTKEMHYCDDECSRKYAEHYVVKKKINFMKKAKHWAEELEKGYEEQLEKGFEDGEMPSTLILIHYYKAIINFIRNKISEETFQFFAQDAMEVGNQISDAVYLSIIRDTQYAIAMMA